MEDLNKVRDDLTANYHLTNNIDLTGLDWEPIGLRTGTLNDTNSFTGIFDGQGYVINGLEIATFPSAILLRLGVTKRECECFLSPTVAVMS